MNTNKLNTLKIIKNGIYKQVYNGSTWEIK